MTTITYDEFKRRVWALQPESTLVAVTGVIDSFTEEIRAHVLEKGVAVRIPNLGTFYRREISGRKVTQYRTGADGTRETVNTFDVPPQYSVRFRPASTMRRKIK